MIKNVRVLISPEDKPKASKKSNDQVYVEGPRIAIDDELANMLAILIDNSKRYSNQDNNPNDYIFVRYKGSRKGNPYAQK